MSFSGVVETIYLLGETYSELLSLLLKNRIKNCNIYCNFCLFFSFEKAEFFCLRHELVDLLQMPFLSDRYSVGIKFYLTKVKGKIYLRRIVSDGDLQHETRHSDFESTRIKQGLIFHHYLISSKLCA